MGGIGAIAIGAVGATFLLLLGAMAVRIYGHSRWQRTIWAFKLPAGEQPKIIIETIEGQETGLYRRPTAGLGAVAAVAQLSTALDASRSGLVRRMARSLEHPVALSFSSEPLADEWCSNADTVIVGGPKSNQITAQVLRGFGCQPPPGPDAPDDELLRRTGDLRMSPGAEADGLGVATQGNSIYWFGKKYAGHVTFATDEATGKDAYMGYDYGVLLRLPSPTNEGRRSVVVFGSQTFGVDAASSWLVNLRRRTAGARVRRLMATQKNVAVLVEADVKHGTLGEPKLKDIVVLPDRLAPRHW
ncbi:MAG TPA: hypothetical protein VFI47_03020 [Acidimicrobiales bacterium]|nr:hypothetical protein [Acidimicrobiales bacterium]